MAEGTAQLSNYRQSPRKVRLIADMVRGKRVVNALATLEMMPKRAAAPLAKLIRSAAANARTLGAGEDLYISKIEVGQGIVFRRSMPRARGSASLIKKKASHIKIELTANNRQPTAKAKSKKVVSRES